MTLPHTRNSTDTPLDRARKHFQNILGPLYLSETRSYDQALREQALGLALVEKALALAPDEHLLVSEWMKEQGGGTLEDFFSVYPYVGLSLGLLSLALVGGGELYAGSEALRAISQAMNDPAIENVVLGGRIYALNDLHLAVVRRAPKQRRNEWA